jgi:gliding motility-associated-like protein
VYYAWSPNTTISDTTILQPIVCPPASQWYYLDVRHRDCSTRDSVLINIGPEIGATATADTSVICQYGSVQLGSAGSLGTEFAWYPPTGLDDPASPNPIASPDTTTTYVLVVSEGACFDTTSITIEVLPGPDAEYASSLPEGCAPHPVQFTNLSTGGIFHIWDFGDGSPVSNEVHPSHIYTQAGDYTVTLTVISGGACNSIVDSIRILVQDPAIADFISDPAFPVQLTLPSTQVNFIDRSVGARNWYWDFGDGITSTETNPGHQYTDPGEYFVTLIVNSALGCVNQVTHGPFIVMVPDLFIPNVFSPNDDGINDVFRVDYSGDQPFNVQVFDRWGVMIYESRNKVEGWKGNNMKGDKVSEGIYYYHVKVGDRKFAGDVTLIR